MLSQAWPTVFKSLRVGSLAEAGLSSASRTTRVAARARYSSASNTLQASPNKRYGSANAPPPHLDSTSTNPALSKEPAKSATAQYLDVKPLPPVEKPVDKPVDKSVDKVYERKPLAAKVASFKAAATQETTEQTSELSEKIEKTTGKTTEKLKETLKDTTKAELNAGDEAATALPMITPQVPTSNALNQILQMEPPMSDSVSAEDKPPHLQASPFVHHFDTHTLVKALEKDGGWTPSQSVDLMKALRGLLAANIELARDGIVSKGDAEMESYLFRAACSELRTEIRQRRDAQKQEMATSRTMLQHEVDILSQRIAQETLTLKDELKGMFDDRKMAVRMERREAENKIQELNYKITIALNSEMRSEVEGLRWVMTRRTVIALAAIVIMTLVTLRYAKYMETKQSSERKAFAVAQESAEQTPSSEALRKRIEAGDNPALVTLG